MKKVFKRFVLVVMLIVGIVAFRQVDRTVVRDAMVYQIDNNVITFEDTANNLWTWEKEENETFEKGQTVKLIMNTKGTTDTQKDDEIMKIRLDK